MNEQERQTFLAEPRVGVLSVASGGDRPPLTIPIWYSYEPGSNLSFFTGTMGRKARKTALIQRAGVVSLSVQRADIPYKYVTVEGTVVGVAQPPSAEQLLAVARRYLPEEHAHFTIRPDRWLAADFSEGAE